MEVVIVIVAASLPSLRRDRNATITTLISY
jgi:hypothetical protein